MSIKLQILFVACIICAFALNVAFGRPDTGIDPVGAVGLNVSGNSTERQKRDDGCLYKGGCHKGYCWAYCEGFGRLDATGTLHTEGPEWCYTTAWKTQDRRYIHCKRDGDCSNCWACAGPCSV